MTSSQSESAGPCFTCGQLGQFKACVQRSEWDRAAGLMDHLDSCWTWLKQVMDKALADQQWHWVIRLFRKCQEVQQASRVVAELVNNSQWPGVSQLMEVSLSAEEMDGGVCPIIQQGQGPGVKQTVGCESGCWSEWLCQQAVVSGQWDLVLQLIKRGVNAAQMNSLLQSALGHQHVQCTATLMGQGVSKHCREEGLRQQIAAGHGGFVLEVVRTVRDPDLTDFVLRESMKQSQWPLVSGLVKEGLSVAQMESVCDQAVADQQWTVALQLLCDGVSASERIINELFQNNKVQDLLDLFPVGSVPEGLKGLLLMGSVKFNIEDLTMNIIERESFSDSELMEVIKFAVHLLDKAIFLRLLSGSRRAHRVFKQKFAHQHWKESLEVSGLDPDGGEVKWMFEMLFDEGYKDLAFFVATSAKSTCSAIDYLCWWEWEYEYFSLKPKKYNYALRKFLQFDLIRYRDFVEQRYKDPETSKCDRSFLFRHTLLMGYCTLTQDLCKYGVSRKDLKTAFQWMVLGELDKDRFHWIICELCDREKEEDVIWLQQYALKTSMKEYFENRSDSNLKIFMTQFTDQCGSRLARQIFRKAIRKCMELDCADVFAMLCGNHKREFVSVTSVAEIKKDHRFAYTIAIDGNRPLFISKLCEETMEKLSHQCDEMLQLVNIIMKRGAWHMLACVSSGLKYLSFSDEAIKLLKRCVVKMLSDQSVWPHIAAMLDQWINHALKGIHLKRTLTNTKAKITAGQWAFNVSSVKQWCVDIGHANLAFFLSLVTEDWETLTTVVTTLPSLDLNHDLLWTVMDLVAEKRIVSASMAMLNRLPFQSYSSHRRQPRTLIYLSQLVAACEGQGMMHWALVLMTDSPSYILEKHQLCQNPDALNFVLNEAVENHVWDIVKALSPRCTESGILRQALKNAVWSGKKTLAEELYNRVDPTLGYQLESHDQFLIEALLYGAVVGSQNFELRVEMVNLFISAGLATFEMSFRRAHYGCPLLRALEKRDLKIIKLLLASGAFSHKRLCNLWKEEWNPEWLLVQLANEAEDSEWRKGYRLITRAAATPLRLEHSARLVASHSIGCGPGRSDRINSLPVPEPIRYLLNFKDIVTMDLSRVEEEV